MTATDEQLLAEYQASASPEVFDELVGRHLGNVRNLAYRMVLCNATADDVTQDVLVKVMHHAHSFRGDAKFSTWLTRIAINTAKQHLRRRRIMLDIDGNDGHVASPQHDRPEQQAMDSELATEIEQALSKLSIKLRAALVLTIIEQVPVKEAAEIEGCTTATMHWRVHQARKQLKQQLHPHLES